MADISSADKQPKEPDLAAKLEAFEALLAENEKLRAVVRAAKEQRHREELMLSVVPIGAWGEVHAGLMTAWIAAGAAVDDALTALDSGTSRDKEEEG